MKTRTLLIVLVVFVVVLALSYVGVNNSSVLSAPIVFHGEYKLPSWVVIVSSFFLGVFFSAGLYLLRDSRGLLAKALYGIHIRGRKKAAKLLKEGKLVRRLSGPSEAVNIYEKVLKLDPTNVEALLEAGATYREVGKLDEAEALHKKAMDLHPDDPQALLSLAQDFKSRGETQACKEALGRLVAGQPKKSLQALKEMRDICIQQGQWEEADQHQKRIAALAPDDARGGPEEDIARGIRFELAKAMAREGKSKEALAALKAIVKQDAEFSPAYVALAVIHESEGDDDLAQETLIKGFAQTRKAILLEHLTDHFIRIEQPKLAIETLRGLLAGSPEPELVQYQLGRLFWRLEMLEEAGEQFAALPAGSFSPLLGFYIGQIKEKRDDTLGAAHAYRDSLDALLERAPGYECSDCRAQASAWTGRCRHCGRWGTLDAIQGPAGPGSVNASLPETEA